MIKSGYTEGLYYREDMTVKTEEVEKYIWKLLGENHGVGIIAGYYEIGYPLCMVSELAMSMLGFDLSEEFEQATGNKLSGLVSGDEYLKKVFGAHDGICEVYFRGKHGNLWVRLVMRDITVSNGQRLWIASVCDIDALYKKDMQVSRVINDKQELEILHREKLENVNKELECQKKELEQILHEAELDNEIISAIGKIYWMIFAIDLEKGTFEEITVSGSGHHLIGERGCVAERFPKACRRTICDEHKNFMLEFLDISTLTQRLKDRDEISKEYCTLTGNWHLGRFIVQKRNKYKKVTKVLYTIQIINEQKKQEIEYEKRLAGIAEEAQRASLSKTDFLRRMSHDIRTPLNGIRGMIEIANHFPNDIERQNECREKIWEASGYLLSLLNSVLDMNKLESGAVILANTPFDLRQILKECNSIAQMQATEHGLRYVVSDFKWDNAHPYLIGSTPHLKQILMNIVGNAVKYNKENGEIRVDCNEISCDGDTVVYKFICTDTGIGMSGEFQKKAFEPFTQEGKDNARTHYDGSGLGLSIVKSLVDIMGGTVEFESEEGVGTTFCVTLPFKLDKRPKKTGGESAKDTVSLSGVRVLLAEDNELNMEIAKFIIEQHGGDVVIANNGLDALKMFSASDIGYYDIILMDIMMPIMNGYEATKKIRALDRANAKCIPIIAMSANAFQDDVLKSKSAGMDNHLSKPISAEKLLWVIRQYV